MASPKIKHHALAIPLPAQGHINPLMRLCKKLAREGFTITFVNTDPIHHRLEQLKHQRTQPGNAPLNGPIIIKEHSCSPGAEEALRGTSENGEEKLDDIRRAHVPIDGLDLSKAFNLSAEDFLGALKSTAPHVEKLIHQLDQQGDPVTCLISDVYMIAATQYLVHTFRLPRIAFFPSSQTFLLFCNYLREGSISTKEVLDVVAKGRQPSCAVFVEGLEGLPPVLKNGDLPHFKHMTDDSAYMFNFLNDAIEECNNTAHAVAVNSCEELEAAAFKTLSSRMNPPLYGVGPLVEPLEEESTTSLWQEDDACLLWLDQQAPLSVLYISFGSITVLSFPQFEEFLSGLLSSQQPFLWVFRPGLVETPPYPLDPLTLMSKTHGKGYFVDWAPQLRVLSHPSIGGFLTHCGWNSTSEAISHGVPMLCWPYFADQFLDARHVVELWENGLEFRKNHDRGLIERHEVEKVIRALMEGEEGKVVRRNATQLKEASSQSALLGGSSYRDIQALIQSLS